MNKQTIWFFVIGFILIGGFSYALYKKTSNIKPTYQVEQYDSLFMGKWKRTDGLMLEYIKSPTCKFQVIEEKVFSTQGTRFFVGQYKYYDIKIIDYKNKIFKLKSISSVDVDDDGEYYVYDVEIRLLNDSVIMVYDSVSGAFLNKLK